MSLKASQNVLQRGYPYGGEYSIGGVSDSYAVFGRRAASFFEKIDRVRRSHPNRPPQRNQ